MKMNEKVAYKNVLCYNRNMSSGDSRIGARFDRWVDEWKMAITGIVLSTRNKKFLVVALITFLIFGTLMNLLSSSTAALDLFWATDILGKLRIIGDSFLAVFGIGRNFWDWLLTFLITLLQSVLIGLVVLVWQKKRHTRRERILAGVQNADNVQSAGLVAGLAVLGSGCPTCGTTLLMPILGTVFSSGGMTIAGAISWILTVGAVLLALFSLKRIGKDAYVMMLSEAHMKRKKEEVE